MNRSFISVGGVPPLYTCDFEFKDDGIFRCKKAYVNAYTLNNQKYNIAETRYSTGFNCKKSIPYDVCANGIEVAYDIAWGTDWPIRHTFRHGETFKGKTLNLNYLHIRISGACRTSHVEIEDGSGNKFDLYP